MSSENRDTDVGFVLNGRRVRFNREQLQQHVENRHFDGVQKYNSWFPCFCQSQCIPVEDVNMNQLKGEYRMCRTEKFDVYVTLAAKKKGDMEMLPIAVAVENAVENVANEMKGPAYILSVGFSAAALIRACKGK